MGLEDTFTVDTDEVTCDSAAVDRVRTSSSTSSKQVVFVDADQIVGVDLKEFVDLDLHGAPYGYVPMGDHNYEMEGYRFWKTGYWRDFLAGLPFEFTSGRCNA